MQFCHVWDRSSLAPIVPSRKSSDWVEWWYRRSGDKMGSGQRLEAFWLERDWFYPKKKKTGEEGNDKILEVKTASYSIDSPYGPDLAFAASSTIHLSMKYRTRQSEPQKSYTLSEVPDRGSRNGASFAIAWTDVIYGSVLSGSENSDVQLMNFHEACMSCLLMFHFIQVLCQCQDNYEGHVAFNTGS